MKNIKFIKLLIFMALGTTSLYAEPSVYGFNQGQREQSSQPSFKVQKEITKLKRKIASQKERIDGLTTIVEGLSASMHDLKLKKNGSGGKANSGTVRRLERKLRTIEENYVTEASLKKALGKTYTPSKSNTHDTTSHETTSKSLKSKSNATLYSEGVRLYGKKRYNEAKKRFKITDGKGYKAAASNYYMGEISYYSKAYEAAIFNYKKSAGLDDQASYIGTLLLHTAVALERTGDKEQAKAFYENIISNFDGQKVAKIAKSKMKKL